MTDTTIFLATDGRHTTLGRGDAVDMPLETLNAICANGLQGWLTILTGDYYRRGKISLARVHSINGAADADWDAAVALFREIRQVGR
ncbi:MAG: hypothetical protein ACRYG8_03200 [Janthinobacterium lividum]